MDQLPNSQGPIISEVRLERFRLLMLQNLSEDIFTEDCKIDISDISSFLSRSFSIRLQKEIWGHDVGNYTFTAPSSWWDHFKLRWFPAWAVRRWPAIMKVERISFRSLYPDFKPALPDLRHVIHIRKLENDNINTTC